MNIKATIAAFTGTAQASGNVIFAQTADVVSASTILTRH